MTWWNYAEIIGVATMLVGVAHVTGRFLKAQGQWYCREDLARRTQVIHSLFAKGLLNSLTAHLPEDGNLTIHAAGVADGERYSFQFKLVGGRFHTAFTPAQLLDAMGKDIDTVFSVVSEVLAQAKQRNGEYVTKDHRPLDIGIRRRFDVIEHDPHLVGLYDQQGKVVA